MYLHIDDARPTPDTIESAISRREAVILSVTGHVVAILLMLWVPQLPFMQKLFAPVEATQVAQVQRQPTPERTPPFVMVEPRIDREALRALERPAPLSDMDRRSQTRERPPNPRNTQPFSRGNTSEFIEADRQAARARGEGPSPEPAPPPPPQT
ncbi:MAG TPA: hypothetical protein VIL35_02805, partial [Vicinamibacterales bacterium]